MNWSIWIADAYTKAPIYRGGHYCEKNVRFIDYARHDQSQSKFQIMKINDQIIFTKNEFFRENSTSQRVTGFFFTINKSLRFYSNIVFSRKNSFGILWNSKNRLKLIWSPLKIIFFQFVVIFLMVIRKRLRLDKLKNILEKNST